MDFFAKGDRFFIFVFFVSQAHHVMDQGCGGPPWTGHGRGGATLPHSSHDWLCQGLSPRGYGERAESLEELLAED
jgi:hypothetical protein